VIPRGGVRCLIAAAMVGWAAGGGMAGAAVFKDGASEQSARHTMVEELKARGIADPAVLAAMRAVPRHLFVSPDSRANAYEDHALPIGYGQTISQPYIVALMTELARVKRDQRVLEIGTGSGYQAAVLARLGAVVDSIEIVPALAEKARQTLANLGVARVRVRLGDGFRGWPEEAPFDAILLTAAPPGIPPPLLAQLKPGGRMVLPMGDASQTLLVVVKHADGSYEQTPIMPVRFVPMTGEAQHPPR
jgi:protein-L-isoaspartate(D-aspartate) O-methyltransferase